MLAVAGGTLEGVRVVENEAIHGLAAAPRAAVE
jgi:hypothetical protein